MLSSHIGHFPLLQYDARPDGTPGPSQSRSMLVRGWCHALIIMCGLVAYCWLGVSCMDTHTEARARALDYLIRMNKLLM